MISDPFRFILNFANFVVAIFFPILVKEADFIPKSNFSFIANGDKSEFVFNEIINVRQKAKLVN